MLCKLLADLPAYLLYCKFLDGGTKTFLFFYVPYLVAMGVQYRILFYFIFG